MKSRKLSRKLSLQKTTISDLDNREMNQVEGGKYTDVTCFTRCYQFTCYGTCYDSCSCWPPCPM
jgi:natural product precursor